MRHCSGRPRSIGSNVVANGRRAEDFKFFFARRRSDLNFIADLVIEQGSANA